MKNKRTYLIETARLGLRTWRVADQAPFAVINANEQVMEYFPSRMSWQQTQDYIDRIRQHFLQHGFGLYVVDELATGKMIGCVGFNKPTFKADFMPCVEIAWRLHPQVWGQGYATEAAQACLDYGWQTLGLEEVTSFTAIANKRSARIMQKIGMERKGEFDHPNLSSTHWLCPHVWYRIQSPTIGAK